MGSLKELISFIEEELSRREWSKADLSRKSRISQAHISRILNGDYQPGLDFYNSMAVAFDLSLEYILRISGILETTPQNNPIIEQTHVILDKLDKSEQELVLGFIQLLKSRKIM